MGNWRWHKKWKRRSWTKNEVCWRRDSQAWKQKWRVEKWTKLWTWRKQNPKRVVRWSQEEWRNHEPQAKEENKRLWRIGNWIGSPKKGANYDKWKNKRQCEIWKENWNVW